MSKPPGHRADAPSGPSLLMKCVAVAYVLTAAACMMAAMLVLVGAPLVAFGWAFGLIDSAALWQSFLGLF